MKGNEKLIQALNMLLAEELTVINQYMLHSEMCENWGYGKLHEAIGSQAMDEMHHAEWLIERILFLDGAPTISKINPVKIGKTVDEIIESDRLYEVYAVDSYNETIKLAREVGDQTTLDLLAKILKMEEDHVDWAEIQQTHIQQMGIQNYLAESK